MGEIYMRGANRALAGAATFAAVTTVASLAVAPAATAGASRQVGVIVQASSVAAARDAVQSVGGRARVALPIVSGVSARIPAGELGALRAAPGVVAVTPDEHLAVAGLPSSGGNGTPSVFRQETGADSLAAAGDTGQGAVVALVDTGVHASSPDLAGRVITGLANPASQSGAPVDCINFSGEPSCDDSYGHGTFMAGLIAGTGAQSGGMFTGEAPGAQIINVKIAGQDGSADVTKVLAAIQWVVSFRTSYKGPGVSVPPISVLNLSLGTDSTDSYQHDPLNLAVERAWESGIAVIVSASNRGPASGTIDKPGDDPLVITVGASDDRGTPAVSDDVMPAFSGRGPTHAPDNLAKPDVVAPGANVVSLRSPGSYIETTVPSPSTSDLYGTPYRRGSGTSMATAITSGAAALLWSRWSTQPGFDASTWPDRLKFALTATAHKIGLSDPMAVGAGEVNVSGAATAPPGLANTGVTTLSDGTSSLDAARGTEYVSQRCTPVQQLLTGASQCVVQGQETAQGGSYQAQQYANGQWNASTWYADQWTTGNTWEGNTWEGNTWEGNTWEGNTWEGSSWDGNSDPTTSYGSPTVGSAWYGAWD
jgi:serine protease AprX